MYRTFSQPLPGGEEVERDLNVFLSSHRILGIVRHLVTRREGDCEQPYLVYNVEYAARETGGGYPLADDGRPTTKGVDYAAVLDPESFRVFDALRKMRKEAAKEESVSAFMIFTNAQLAEIAQKRPTSLADLGQIQDVGKRRLERYGQRVLDVLSAIPSEGNGGGSGSPKNNDGSVSQGELL